MERCAGTLYGGGKAVSVTVSLSVTNEGESRQSWFGGFLWPPGEHLEPGGPYRVELDDGRAGDVLILYHLTSDGCPGAAFRGTGPLE
jgi:hypothetical protein